MKTFILYHPNSEQARNVEMFVHDFGKRYGADLIELISVDTIVGSDKASVYGVVQYPSIIVTDSSGVMIKSWEGESMPLISELAYYTQDL